jgi:molecular chaperone GrpE (heat shock protein)
MQQKDTEIFDLKKAQNQNDQILKKHMTENQTLKKQLSSGASGPQGQSPLKRPEALPAKRDFKSMRAQKKETSQQSIELFNQKFLSDLEG